MFCICGWKVCFWPVSTEVKGELKEWPTKWWNLHLKSLQLFCVPLLGRVQIYSDSKEEKQFIFTFWAWICHHAGHHFIYPRWSKVKATAFWITWPEYLVQHQVSGGHHVGMWHTMQCASLRSKAWLTCRLSQVGSQNLMWLVLYSLYVVCITSSSVVVLFFVAVVEFCAWSILQKKEK